MILAATIAYSDADFVRLGVERFYKSATKADFDRHILFDPGFPIPNSGENTVKLLELCEEYKVEYVKIKNYGCHQNFDYASKYLNLDKNDFFITACPDINVTPGWIKAGLDVLKADPGCFTVQMNHFIGVPPPSHRQLVIGNQNVMQFPQLCAWSTGIFNMEHINSIGGFGAYSKFYSYCEHYLVDKLVPQGKRWYLLRDYYDRVQKNPCEIYTEWKLQSAMKRTEKDFESWYNERQRAK